MSSLPMRVSDFERYYQAAKLGLLHFPIEGCLEPDRQHHRLHPSGFAVSLEGLHQAISGEAQEGIAQPIRDILAVIVYGVCVGPSFESHTYQKTRFGIWTTTITEQIPITEAFARFLVITEHSRATSIIDPTYGTYDEDRFIRLGGIHVDHIPLDQIRHPEHFAHGVPIIEHPILDQWDLQTPRRLYWTSRSPLTGHIS